MAPAFIFVDPYGFNIPWSLLKKLMKFSHVELFVNVMWRELDMAICQGPAADHGQASNLDEIFGCEDWQGLAKLDSPVERADEAARLLMERVGAKWRTHIRMMRGNKAVRCFLLHLTNHKQGRDLMKKCVWKACPDGDFYILNSYNPNQLALIEREPDLGQLRSWVLEQLGSGAAKKENLQKALLPLPWLPKHLNQSIRDLKMKQLIQDQEGGELAISPQDRLF